MTARPVRAAIDLSMTYYGQPPGTWHGCITAAEPLPGYPDQTMDICQ